MRRIVNMVLLPIVMSILFAGCAAPQLKHSNKRIFYPPLPDRPRIEYIGTYMSQHAFPKTRGQLMREAILGQEPPFRFGRPLDTASCGDGKVYVSDTLIDRVFVYDFNVGKVSFLTEGGGLDNPTGLATDRNCNIYVANTKKKNVLVYDKNGKPYFSFGGAKIFEWPSGIIVDDERGQIYVTDLRKHDVMVFDMKGKLLFSFLDKADRDDPVDGGFSYPADIDVLSDGRVIVLDAMNARVKVYSPSGDFMKTWGQRGDTATTFGMIKGVAIDNEDHIYITDADNNMVKVFNVDGEALTAFGGKYTPARDGMMAAGGFSLISGIDIDPKNGIFIADQMNKSFQVFQFLDDEYLKMHPFPVYEPEKIEKGKGWDEINK